MKKLLITLLFATCLSINQLSAQEVDVQTIQFGTDVQERELIGTDSTFANTVESVYCYTHVTGAQDSTQIAHVWYYKEEERARISLNIKSSDWRTWSSKKILPSWTGTWRVMVEDADGNVLATGSFVIKDE